MYYIIIVSISSSIAINTIIFINNEIYIYIYIYIYMKCLDTFGTNVYSHYAI